MLTIAVLRILSISGRRPIRSLKEGERVIAILQGILEDLRERRNIIPTDKIF